MKTLLEWVLGISVCSVILYAGYENPNSYVMLGMVVTMVVSSLMLTKWA